MTVVAFVVAAAITVFAAALRFGGASLVRTPRADALHDAAEDVAGADAVARLLEDRAAIQPSLGLVHAALLVAAAVPAAWAMTTVASGWTLLALLAGLGVALVLLAESLPRSFGRARPRVPAYRLARILEPAVRIGERANDLIEVEDDEESDSTSEEDDDDPYDAEEIQLISSVLEFTDAIVREVMVPRIDMITVSATDDTDEALDVVIEEGRSRVPVVGGSLDDIAGVLYARDLLSLMDEGSEPVPVTAIMRPAHFVPETQRVSDLLRELQGSKVHLAIVVDEFGGTAGLVTIEDLVEEIVGEIVDEFDVEEPMVTPLAGGSFLVDARMHVEDFAAILGAELPADEWDTMGGLVLGLAGRVPEEGERFTHDALVFTAERVQGRRVARVRVEPAVS
ncbi:MAG: hemolysin family protein [Acidimicrobiia bacterium]|nr:hemolysin family protein [Acidimicrobiia bacterium]